MKNDGWLGSLKYFRPLIGLSTLTDSQKEEMRTIFDLIDAETEEEVTYQIVGDIEADINQNRIAISSPIARAIIGKEEGEEVVVQAPAGDREYEITAVHYI